ncbi:MAG: hypothetical protein ABJC55_18160, partial [Algoriphagus sp.]
NPEDQSKLMDSLKKGNRQSVTFSGSEGEQKRFVEASPQFKNVNTYDANQVRTAETQREGKSESQTKTKKQEVNEESDESPTKKTRKRKSAGIAG